ncbi:Zinc finger protein DPF3-like protein [Dinothrombium tinctorium]|uniref:Zinc finger protein DPF3-like protein n=1 Tax=Dinothrombium tinctorium TaxID=1965070 RepID=A0A443REE4_9ACAR|nr:Zinc finger protein DPF3-like protein [Dinothrombium tinctorium]
MSNGVNVRNDILSKIKSILNEHTYREAMENSSQYNNRLVVERRLRLPFLDAQTGVAQSDCFLWMQKWERMPGKCDGQLYTYPARKWRKKRRQYLMTDTYLTRKNRENEFNDSESNSMSNENSVKMECSDSNEKYFETSRDGWYPEYDDGSDLPDAGELDDPESDYDDYEEYSSRKRRRKRDTQKRKRVEYSDAEKPYSCDICGARYKTRPGLSYHYSHSHQNDGERGNRGPPGMEEEDMPYTPPRQMHSQGQHPPQPPPASATPVSVAPPSTSMPPISTSQQHLPPSSHNIPQHTSSSSAMSAATRASAVVDDTAEGNNIPSYLLPFTDILAFTVPRTASDKPLAAPSSYCDFCLGDTMENKKTKSAEELVSCSDCGRSAHPTCLQFTANMIKSVKKYRWQCIECKSCGLCGTSDNDDQLLFCDDCDRGYHMYCLHPPLSEPPEGSWSCHLCIEEYHTPKK